jgi:hypothetical protein
VLFRDVGKFPSSGGGFLPIAIGIYDCPALGVVVEVNKSVQEKK